MIISLYRVITWKLLIGKGNFSGVTNKNFVAAGWDSSSIYRVSPNVMFRGRGKDTAWTLPWTKGFNSYDIFQISHDYETENVHQRQKFFG